ncbi:hypothetical protein HED51_24450 [Ochrobactrum grignonense]|nr:hypothetical protein [Brucella grignonensis]
MPLASRASDPPIGAHPADECPIVGVVAPPRLSRNGLDETSNPLAQGK